MKKINILYLIDRLWGFGGSEKHLFNLLIRINKNKFSGIVCPFQSHEHGIVKSMRENGIKVIPLFFKRVYSYDSVRKAFEIRRIIKEFDIDIVQTFHFFSDTYGVLVSKLCGVPIIISSRRDMGDKKGKKKVYINRKINKLIDHFIMVCDSVGRRMSEIEFIPESKMTTIYNGIDLEYFKPLSPNTTNLKKKLNINNEFVIGSVAHFRPEKDYDTFFKAIKEIKPLIKKLKVLVLGGGDNKKAYKQFCIDNSLHDTVIFVRSEDVREYISIMDVACLVPKINEGFSNALLEEMALEKPVIVTSVGGSAEVIIDGKTGFLIPPKDVNELVNKIVLLYKNPELRVTFGKNARKRVEEKFTIDKMVRSTEELYNKLYENMDANKNENKKYY